MDQVALHQVRGAKVTGVVEIAGGLVLQLHQTLLAQSRYPEPRAQSQPQREPCHAETRSAPWSRRTRTERRSHDPQRQIRAEQHRRDVVRQDQQAAAASQAGYRQRIAPADDVQGCPKQPGEEPHSRELGKRIPAHVHIHEVERRVRVRCRSQDGRWPAGAKPTRQPVGAGASQQEASQLCCLNAADQAQPEQVQRRRTVIGQGSVKVVKGVTEPLRGIGHPARREDASAQVVSQLLDALEQKHRVSAGACVGHPRPGNQRERRSE